MTARDRGSANRLTKGTGSCVTRAEELKSTEFASSCDSAPRGQKPAKSVRPVFLLVCVDDTTSSLIVKSQDSRSDFFVRPHGDHILGASPSRDRSVGAPHADNPVGAHHHTSILHRDRGHAPRPAPSFSAAHTRSFTARAVSGQCRANVCQRASSGFSKGQPG